MPPVVRFGSSFELRNTERVLLAHGSPLPLGSRALDVPVALVARQGALVTKDELLSSAWPANVHVAVSQLRKLLGKAAISTVGGLGYRLALALHADVPTAPDGLDGPITPALPQPRTAFVGRQTELAEAAAQLQHTQLLTLVAMGGMGKTRLALQLAQALQGRYADGVFFVDLQPLQDGSGLPGAVARALALGSASSAGNASGTGVEASTAALLRCLQQRQLLLVLDNCEHRLPPVLGLLAALLAQAPGVTVLATSRQALELPGERVYALRPLQLPAAEDPTPQALSCEAVQLFLQRVLADNPGFFSTDGTSTALLCDICRRLDGIPLALELAAARLNMLSLLQLHTLLAQRFELLSCSGPGGTTRQQTLQDVLQWSHEHLAPAEQSLAQAVAVCSGGFYLETAVALVNAAPADHSGAPGTADTGPGPLAVLDSLAQLADRALIHVSHAARLDAERDNLLAALAFSQQPGSLPADHHRGLEMVAALKNFWFASGWLEKEMRAAAAALCFAGRIAVKSEDTGSGEQLLQEGLRRARQVQALAVVGEALNALAFAAIERDDLDAAEGYFGEALLASPQRGSALGGVIETLNLAWVAVMRGATPRAMQGVIRGVTMPGPPTKPERARQLLLSVWHTLQTMPHRYLAQRLIDVCASFALHGGHCEVAALLHGASATQRHALQLPLTAKQAARRASEAAAARAALGEAGYEAAAAQGRLQQHAQTLAHVGGWLQTVVLPVPPVAATSAPQAITQARTGARSSGRRPAQPV